MSARESPVRWASTSDRRRDAAERSYGGQLGDPGGWPRCVPPDAIRTSIIIWLRRAMITVRSSSGAWPPGLLRPMQIAPSVAD